MDIDRICCRCNKPLLTGYYYFDNTFGICIDCITKLSVFTKLKRHLKRGIIKDDTSMYFMRQDKAY